jgi:hypothetical protein
VRNASKPQIRASYIMDKFARAAKMENEEWKSVEGYPNYEISNIGRVRTLAHSETFYRGGKALSRKRPAKLRKTPISRLGYPVVELSNGEGPRQFLVHVLVAEAFIGEAPEGKPFVLHNDDNPLNACICNLRYGSPLENSADMVERDRSAKGSKHGLSVLNEISVAEIKSKFAGNSNAALGRMYGVHADTIRDIRSGRTWHHV